MGSVCAEQTHHHNRFHLLSAAVKTNHHLQDVSIPPRKLLSRRTMSPFSSDAADLLANSTPPNFDTNALVQKFLPHNDESEHRDGLDLDCNLYSSNQFRMYEFKVRRCTRSRSHDWTDCPFAHPGEKARRRDPRKYHYSSTVCSEYRRGSCNRGDYCDFSHGVFECWLHPTRYRTEACKDGKNCKRKICFFAHSSRELRILPLQQEGFESYGEGNKYQNSTMYNMSSHYCSHCIYSPTSPTLGVSHFLQPLSPPCNSPPISPIKVSRDLSGFSPVSQMGDGVMGDDRSFEGGRGFSFKDVLIELMESMEDVNLSDDQHQCQFVLSPTPTPGSNRKLFSSDAESVDSSSSTRSNNINGVFKLGDEFNESGLAGPDLGWVNELLM